MQYAGLGKLSLVVGAGAIVLAANLPAQSTRSGVNSGSAPSSSITSYANGDIDLGRSMTAANIFAHLATGDSLEITLAQNALMRSRDSRVRDFAQALVQDHTLSLEQGQQRAQQAGVVPLLASNDTMLRRMLTLNARRLANGDTSMNRGTASGNSSWRGDAQAERQFITDQIALHRTMIRQLQALRARAQPGPARAQIDAVLPVMQRHLDQAQRIGRDIGAGATSSPGSAAAGLLNGVNGRGGLPDSAGGQLIPTRRPDSASTNRGGRTPGTTGVTGVPGTTSRTNVPACATGNACAPGTTGTSSGAATQPLPPPTTFPPPNDTTTRRPTTMGTAGTAGVTGKPSTKPPR